MGANVEHGMLESFFTSLQMIQFMHFNGLYLGQFCAHKYFQLSANIRSIKKYFE